MLRSAWDGRPLALLTRTAPARATAAHIAIIGHITAAELVHHTTPLEVANGLLNRFVFVACRRVRLLPEGGDPDPLAGTGLAERVGRHLGHARRTRPDRLQPRRPPRLARHLRRDGRHRPGLVGGLLARGEAHVVRLAMLYALVDGTIAIDTEHLHAALALWDYAARSVGAIFGAASGNPDAEQIHAALVASGGMTRTDLRDLFSRNRPHTDIDAALTALQRAGRARPVRVVTGGRPAQLWHPTSPAAR